MPAGDELPLRRVALVGAALAAAVVAVVVAVGLMLHAWHLPWRTDRATLPAGFERPEPSVHDDQPGERAALLMRQQRQLDSLGWVDAEHGWVHVPIDMALASVAASEPSP